MSIDGKRRLAAAAFVALLALSVTWPQPVLSVNEVCCHASLRVDELSFLGREAPSWDVVFWCIAGIWLIAVLQTFRFDWRDLREPWAVVRRARLRRIAPVSILIAAIICAALVLVTWKLFDVSVAGWAERLDSAQLEETIRIFNRLGGGMNPALIVLFFLIVGVAAAEKRWVRIGTAMAMAGAGAGLTAQIIKFAVARVRPELWLGPDVRARHGATSFPSGHTIGAFALGGVLLFASRNLPLRVVAMLLALAIGFARILAFRHWASDVVASALLGLIAAWMASESIGSEPDASSQ